MIEWLVANGATVLVALLIAALAALAVYVLRRDKKRGRSSCGGSCGACPMAGACHANPPKKKA